MDGLVIMRDEASRVGIKLPDDFLEYLLWEETGWPMWWHIGTDGDTPEECLRTQAREAFAKVARRRAQQTVNKRSTNAQQKPSKGTNK